MRVLIFGADGYIGWPLYNYLKSKGHTVWGLDNYFRRMAVESLTPIGASDRVDYLDVTDYNAVAKIISIFKPDTIFNLAQIPSAPYSMASPFQSEVTQMNNTLGTLSILWAMKNHAPDAHLITIGTLGEYGYDDGLKYESPNFIPKPGSFYHASKVFATLNCKMASDFWGLNITDIMQGVVYGTRGPDGTLTRLDYDEQFGTVINRFVVQAVAEHPLTVYGSGNQQRGFLPLKDSIKCLELLMENPADGYRVVNQMAQVFQIKELAQIVVDTAYEYGIDAEINHIPNPRIENENQRDYHVKTETLWKLGYRARYDEIYDVVEQMLKDVFPYKSTINKDKIMPKTRWK